MNFALRHSSTALKSFAVFVFICLCVVFSTRAQYKPLASIQVVGAFLVVTSVLVFCIKHVSCPCHPEVNLSICFPARLRDTIKLRDCILFVLGFLACIAGNSVSFPGLSYSVMDDIDLKNCHRSHVPHDLFVPIFMLTRDRVSSLQKSLQSYWDTITSPYGIIILDHFSTFPPMLEYLQRLGASNRNISVISLKQEEWTAALVEANQQIQNYLHLHPQVSFYVFTDPDVAFLRTAPDVLLFYAGLLKSCPEHKVVGPALQISDIPSHFQGREPFKNQTVYEWESNFWHAVPNMATWNGVGYHVAQQPIDTTFAMFRRDTQFARLIEPSLRAYAPYAGVHVDWYYDSRNLPADKLHYIGRQNGVNNW